MYSIFLRQVLDNKGNKNFWMKKFKSEIRHLCYITDVSDNF